MPSESLPVSPIVAARLSTTRHSGVTGSPTSPPSSMSSQSFVPSQPPASRHNRAMTPGELHNAMEQEQEHITNNLLKHIDQLRADKIRIEHELEAESEAVMNRLTRELSTLRARLEAAGIPAPIETPQPGSQTPRSPSRSPSRASSLSRRSISGANSPRLNPIHGSPGQAPIPSPVPRRDSIEVRGRSTSASGNGDQTHGLERVIESLKHENGEYKKMVRELDDRYRCKQAECERHKEEIASLKMEISLLQRRQSATGSIMNSTNAEAAASVGTPSNVATWCTPDKSRSERTEERQQSNDQLQNNLDSSGKGGERP